LSDYYGCPIGSVAFIVAVRSHTGEMLSVYLTVADIEKVMEFLTRKSD